MRVRIVTLENEIVGLICVDRLGAVGEGQGRKRTRITGQLERRLIKVVGLKVAIAAGPHEHARLQPALSREHMGEQRITGDVERNPEEEIGAALI